MANHVAILDAGLRSLLIHAVPRPWISAFATIGFLIQALTAWTWCAPADPVGGPAASPHAGVHGPHHSEAPRHQHGGGGNTCVCAGPCQQLGHQLRPTTFEHTPFTPEPTQLLRPASTPIRDSREARRFGRITPRPSWRPRKALHGRKRRRGWDRSMSSTWERRDGCSFEVGDAPFLPYRFLR